MTRRWNRVAVATGAALMAVMTGCGGGDTTTAEPADQTATEPTGETAAETSNDTATASSAVSTETGSAAEPAPEPTATPEPVEPFRILVTNDDGVGAAGIDLLVTQLLELPDVEVTVVAPAENQSGSSDTRSEGPLVGTETTTASGYPAIAVAGTPADSVVYALAEVVTEPPHLIVSGSNDGENVGPLAQVSGTVGAARTGAREGIPALAISQGGITVEAEFEVGVPFAIDWVVANRDELQARPTGGLAPVVSINVPSCGTTGAVEGAVETTLAEDYGQFVAFTVDCSAELPEIVTDIEAFHTGYAAITLLPEDLVAGVEAETATDTAADSATDTAGG